MPDSFLAFARRLADAARAETLTRWRTGCVADDKRPGGAWDPVTDADREAERAMRRLIEAEHPDHGVSGEEFPDRPARSRFRWSLDPVDGTRAFVCGVASWVTLIALLDEGRPVLGIIDAPALGELYAGCGSGTLTRQGAESQLAASGCTRLDEARLSSTDPYLFAGWEGEAWERVRARTRTARYGLDGYAYARLAAGSLDLVIESGLKPHDHNALVPIVRASGGWIGNWEGGEDLTEGRVVAAASRALYEAAIETMRYAP